MFDNMYTHILVAERVLLDENRKATESYFSAAIAFPENIGFIHILHDKALSQDIASAFYSAQGQEIKASFHICNALQRTLTSVGCHRIG